MSARSRSRPWFRPPRQKYLRKWAACAEWMHGAGNTVWMWAPTRFATTSDVSDSEVERVLGMSPRRTSTTEE
jgi:hypothetical protein